MPLHGESLAVVAMLTPWVVLSLFLPMPHLALALVLLAALAALLLAAAGFARARAAQLDLDAETWALAAALSLGYANVLLLGVRRGETPFQALCHDCGRLFDGRAQFCYACGSYS